LSNNFHTISISSATLSEALGVQTRQELGRFVLGKSEIYLKHACGVFYEDSRKKLDE